MYALARPLLFERVVTCAINLPVCRPVTRHVTPSLNIYHQDTLHFDLCHGCFRASCDEAGNESVNMTWAGE